MTIEVSTFKVIKETGINGTIKLSGTALLLPDTGDKVEFAISAAVAGKYKIVLKVRSGDKLKNSNYIGSYAIAVDDAALIPVAVTPGTTLESRFGGSYWGTMAFEVNLTAGAHRLSIESKANYTGIDNPIDCTLVQASSPEMVLKSVYDTLNSNYIALLGNFNTLKTQSEALQNKFNTVSSNYTILKSCLSVDKATAAAKLQSIMTSMEAIDSLIS